MSSEDRDLKTKGGARFPPLRASKPGAVAVTAADEAAARLDQRIADKQSQATAASAPAAKPPPIQDDVAAKQRGRGAGVATKPGAYADAAKSATTAAPATASSRLPLLDALERDVEAKIRATPAPGTHSVKYSSSKDPAFSKLQRDSSMFASSGKVAGGGAPAGARTELTCLEDSVIAKVRLAGAPAAGAGATSPGAVAVAAGPSDDGAGAKVRREGAAAAPGVLVTPAAREYLQGVEDSVTSKIRRQAADMTPGAHPVLQTLEDSVGAKIRRETSHAGGVAGAPSGFPEDTVAAKVRGYPIASASAGGHVERVLTNLADSVGGKALYESRSESKVEEHADHLGVLDDAAAARARPGPSRVSSGVDNVRNIAMSKFGDQGAASAIEQELNRLEGAILTKESTVPRSPEETVPGTIEDSGEKLDKDKGGDLLLAPPLEQATSANQGITTVLGTEYGMIGPTGLAVAVAVEEEDDMFIPSAIEYDPDAKPPIYKNRRFRLYAFLALFIIVVVAAGASIAATLGNKPSEPSPTPAPTTIRESLGIEPTIELIVGSELLDDPESPYSKALHWITFDDPQELSPADPNLIQRYTAAYLYFATTVDGPWRTCNPPKNPDTDSPDCVYKKLVNLFPESFEDKPSKAWLSSADECDWAGISCDGQMQVRTVDLAGGLLSGTFPEGISNFLYLQDLSFFWNNMTGTLPAHVVEMDHLISIELHSNMFTGTIPKEWWSSRNLQRINIGENMITGTIPTEVGNLRDMKGFFVMTNLLTGTIPEEIAVMDSVTYFRLSRNSFEGSFPSTFTQLKNINEAWFHRNMFTGTIPEDIGSLSLLADIRFHANPMTGVIPESLWDLDKLWRLDLYECNFTGTLSESIGKLGAGFLEMHINNNMFSGPLPQNMTQLVELYDVWIHGNDFTGTVPQAVCDLKGNPHKSFLEVFQADCAADSSGFIELSCPADCCTTCCKSDGSDCMEMSSGA